MTKKYILKAKPPKGRALCVSQMAINGKRRLPCKVALLRTAFKFSFNVVEVVEKKSNHLEFCEPRSL